MADSILRLKVESQEYDNKLKQATNGLTRYVDECRKVGGTLEVVEKETLDYVRALGQMDTTSRTATGKLAEMKKTFTELSAQYKQMTDAEKASPFGKALAASLDQLKGRIQDSKSQLDEINKSINGGDGLTGALDAVAGKFGLSIDQVTKFGGVVGVATTAVQVAKDAFFQSESGIDEWGRTVEGAKGAYSVFLDTLNNGNWSDFFQNLSAAIQGGRDLYDVFDRLGSIKSNNAAAIAITQKEIAELRLAKQQGENVDAKLKAATERLAALQKQSVSAGMAAGSQSAFQTIRNGVNSVGGAGVNDATIKYVVDKIIKGGQSEFDKYKRNYETLQQRGMVTRTQTINDSQGGTYERQYRVFDINALTKEQQKQYAIAKAITEGETRIQKGIAAYAQAVSEGTSAAREEFKGNRYALQGAGGGGRSGGGGGRLGGGKTTTDPTYAADSIAAQEAEVARLTKLWKEAGDAVRDDYATQLGYAKQKLAEMTGGFNPNNVRPIADLSGKAPSPDFTMDLKMDGHKQYDAMAPVAPDKIEFSDGLQQKMDSLKKGGMDTAKAWRSAQSAIGSVGNALSGLKNPAIDIMTVIGQAIATVALAYAETLAKDKSSKSNIWTFIAAAAASTISLATTIASIHSSTGYAQGGIVKGTSYSGDNIYAGNDTMVNAGELILNRSQQLAVASQLQSNSPLGGGRLVARLKGADILLSLERQLAVTGKGELATFK
jgi:hypothetical protein